VAASGNRELTGDRCEDELDFISKPNQDRDGNDGNKSQYQGVLDKSLAFLSPFLAAGHSLMIHLNNSIFF
jgi:hypothetical protein